MKRLIGLIIILLISVICFAYTITFLGSPKTVPAKLQGRWTETAVSRNKGDTWIDGLSIQVKITEDNVAIEAEDYPVIQIASYKDDKGLFGYLLKLEDVPDDFEFWLIDKNTAILIIHIGQTESMRCRLVR